MQANMSQLRTLERYVPEVERRGHLNADSPGLIRLKEEVRGRIIAHDRAFFEPRPGFHNAALLDHVERVETKVQSVGRALGLSEEDILLLGYMGFFHDYSKVSWLGHRYDGPLPADEIPGKEGHAKLSWVMLRDLGHLLELNPDEWWTLGSISVGLKYHHHPERLAKIAKRIKRSRELKLVTIVNLGDFYCGLREYRGKSHPAVSHSLAMAYAEDRSRDPVYNYARKVVPRIIEALDEPDDSLFL